MEKSLRDQQRRVADWVEGTFGHAYLMDKQERAMRVVEEALEVGQALRLDKEVIIRLMERVYSRPVGEVEQELGGLGVTLLAASRACGASFGDVLNREINRIEAVDPEKFRSKNLEKARAGVCIYGA